jgi:hypothetical protein
LLFARLLDLRLRGFQLAAQLAHQRRRGVLARLAAQFCGPARIFDDCPGDSFVVQRSGFIDMRRKDDPERTLEPCGPDRRSATAQADAVPSDCRCASA